MWLGKILRAANKLPSFHLSMPGSDSLEENKKEKKKCTQTKTQERQNLCGAFQVVASTQAAEQ